MRWMGACVAEHRKTVDEEKKAGPDCGWADHTGTKERVGGICNWIKDGQAMF